MRQRRACMSPCFWARAIQSANRGNAGRTNSHRFLLRFQRRRAHTHRGGGDQVLGSPIKALKYLVRELARYGGESLRAGEFVTTGTLTQALPAAPGDRWRAEARGAEFADIEIRLA